MQIRTIAHLTSVHRRSDTRIFIKECRSLVKAGYDVSLVVADGDGDEQKDGVRIFDVGQQKGRIRRMLVSPRHVLRLGLKLDADVYHLHDPELLTIVGELLRSGKLVVFDSHEDVPEQILAKPYLHPSLRSFSSKMFAAYQSRVCRTLTGIVAATPLIGSKMIAANANTVTVRNYPIPRELAPSCSELPSKKRKQVCYIGGIGKSRGVIEMIDAMEIAKSGCRLALCGRYEENSIHADLSCMRGWTMVDDRGWLDRDNIRTVLNESVAGLVTLHPLSNYIDALPIKMFEYMSAAIPVIASNFPLWREIVESAECGICVDPLNPGEIAAAIDSLARDPDKAKRMGENGRKAVEEIYNWSNEESKLLKLYETFSTRDAD